MLQTIVILVLLAIDAWIVMTNPAAFQTLLTLRASSSSAQVYSVTVRMLMEAAGAALVIAWVAGMIDRAALERRAAQYERTVRVMNDEMARMKARAYDEERQPLEDIRTRLETLDRDVRALRARIDREPLAPVSDTPRAMPSDTRMIRDRTA
ncbi:MAG TPA: hypothetical protein VKW09_11560 [bacterium]|nr:hypothetical protein [bacterium]